MTSRSLGPDTVAAIKQALLTDSPAQVSLQLRIPHHVVQDIHLGRTYTGIKKKPKPRKITKPRCDRQLDAETVARIKRDLLTMTIKAVALRHELSYNLVYSIHTRKTYKEVQPMSTNDDLERRAQAIVMRRLEIAATLAEWKRAFFADGIEHEFKERLTLEAEDAALALEKHAIGARVLEAKLERRRCENATLLAQLVALLIERGMNDLVAEAESRAAKALSAASAV